MDVHALDEPHKTHRSSHWSVHLFPYQCHFVHSILLTIIIYLITLNEQIMNYNNILYMLTHPHEVLLNITKGIDTATVTTAAGNMSDGGGIQGGVDRGLSQGGVDRGVSQGGVDQEVSQGGIDRGVSQGGVDQEVSQGGVDRGVFQGEVDQGVFQGGVDQGVSQGGVDQEVSQGGVDREVSQGRVNGGAQVNPYAQRIQDMAKTDTQGMLLKDLSKVKPFIGT